jgi:CRP-like cAMP-binding protein
MMGREMFLHLTDSHAGSAGAAIARRMRERAEARQRSRLTRAIEMLDHAPMAMEKYSAGDTLYKQGDVATHFYIVKSGQLSSSFISSTGETAELGALSPGDQFGYDAVLGEVHDTTVSCLDDAEVIAIPREHMQNSFRQDAYLQSVWQAPAKRSIELRRQTSQSLLPLSSRTPRSEGRDGGGGASARVLNPNPDRLSPYDFEPMLRRSRISRLSPGQVAFEQGSTPTAMYLLQEGRCDVEHTSREGGERQVVGKLSAGDHFGEGALLEGRSRRHSTVRCVDPAGCKVGILGKGAFDALLEAQPEVRGVLEAASKRRSTSTLRSIVTLAVERSDAAPRTLRANETLFRQGDVAEAFFVVVSGEVQVSYRTADGRRLPSKTHRAGDIFGASELLAGDGTRRNTATALSPTVLNAIPLERVKALMRADSGFAADLRRASTVSPLGPEVGSRKGPRRPAGSSGE